MKKNLSVASLTLIATLFTAAPALAQVAGGTTSATVDVTQSTQVAMGWSVKKSLMGKTIYNDAGQKVGNVEDLIISPDRSVSYVIVGAGGFIGVGRHDVAISITQIQDQAGKLVMPGATKQTIMALPQFDYAYDSAKRDQFVATAEQDIANGKTKVADLEKKADTASADAKVKIDARSAALRVDVKSAETKLGEMKQASANRWKEFEASVAAATARLRKAVDIATS
jgi:sporulation protein YlmC with PRC-barrel domain